MTLDEAMAMLREKYNQVKDNPQIDDAVSWALYRTWCVSKRKKKKGVLLYQGCRRCADRDGCPDAFTEVAIHCGAYGRGSGK